MVNGRCGGLVFFWPLGCGGAWLVGGGARVVFGGDGWSINGLNCCVCTGGDAVEVVCLGMGYLYSCWIISNVVRELGGDVFVAISEVALR